jgi:hypothetical protein
LALSSDSSGIAVFSLTPSGAQTTSVTIPAGSSAVSFHYGDTKAGSIDGALGIGGTGNGYTLEITSGSFAPVISNPFTIT